MVRTLQEIGTGIHQACEEDTKRRTRPNWAPTPDPSFAVDAMGGAVLAAAGLVYNYYLYIYIYIVYIYIYTYHISIMHISMCIYIYWKYIYIVYLYIYTCSVNIYIYIYIMCVCFTAHLYAIICSVYIYIYIYICTHPIRCKNRAQKPGCSDVTLPGDLVTIAKLDGTANDSPVDELDARLDL